MQEGQLEAENAALRTRVAELEREAAAARRAALEEAAAECDGVAEDYENDGDLLVEESVWAVRGARACAQDVRRLAQPLFSSASDRWATPQAVFDKLNAEFQFDFDPCPLDGETDGLGSLFCRWRGRRVFCNPPYGPGLAQWLRRGREASLAVFLIPARTDTRWFHDIVLPEASEIRFLRGRLRFGDAKASAPFPSMVVVFRSESARPPRDEWPTCPECGQSLVRTDALLGGEWVCRNHRECPMGIA